MSLVDSRLGRYQLLRQIGSGGMGTIYLAQDTHMPRQVAVKVVRTDDELQDNAASVQKREKLFYREMQAIAQLDHPHILPVFDFGKEKLNEALYTYLVMQYRPEGSLAGWLRQSRNNNALPPSEIARFTWQAAEALQHAHEHGTIHQDVKPPNFLLRTRTSQPEEPPDLLLADFGIARFFASTASQGLSQSHDVRGTPMFMAPEQWDGKAVPASDQYALAIMVFRMLTGQLPFQGSLGQIMHHHYMVEPPDPSSLNPQLGSSIDKVIKRALAKQPADRFPSILEFARAFTQAQATADDQQSSQQTNISGPSLSQGQIVTLLQFQSPNREGQTSQPGIAGIDYDPASRLQTGQAIHTSFITPRTLSQSTNPPSAYGYPAGPPISNAPSLSLPDILSNPQANQTIIQRRKLSAMQTGLLLGLIALLVLGGGGTLLFKSISASKNNAHTTTMKQSNLQSDNKQLSGQASSSGSGSIAAHATSTPGQSSTPNSGAMPKPGTPATPGVTPGTTPTSVPKPATTPTSASVPPIAPPTATPTPPQCLTDTWISHLNPSFSKGGSPHYVSGYCSGVVSLTLTQAPTSGGHEIDFQICYAPNSTNCTSWVAYTSPNVWRTMATGLGSNQVFYINTRCDGCTSGLTTLNGGVKY